MFNETFSTPSAANKPKPLSIRLDPIVPSEQQIYINNVCSVLIESRFGPERSKPIVIRLTELPELEPAAFYDDITPAGPVPAYTVVSNSEMARRYSEDIIRRTITPPNPYNTTIYIRPDTSPNQGRGSPFKVKD